MKEATGDTTNTRNCLSCGRAIRSARSLATGYGPGCRAKLRKAAQAADLSAWTASQIEDAREVIEDGGVVPSTREGVFHVVSTDGSEVHLTHRDGCTCTNGLLTRPKRPCYHRAAVAIVLAATVSQPAPAPVRVPVAIPAPAPALDDTDIWARLEALGALDLATAI